MSEMMKLILSLSLSGSILVLLLLVGKLLLKNRLSKSFSYYIWLLVLLRLVIPVTVPINVMDSLLYMEQAAANSTMSKSTTPQAEASEQISTGQQAEVNIPAAKTQEPQTSEASEGNSFANTNGVLTLWELFQKNMFWLWLTGAALSLGWFALAYGVFSMRMRRTYVYPNDTDLAVFECMRSNRRIRLVCSSRASTPMLIGLLRPMIILPTFTYVQCGKEAELRYILRHELIHYRRKDILYKWFTVVVTSLHWFNPLMLLIRREIIRTCELSCDEAVIRNMSAHEKQRYGNTLLALAADKKFPAGILATTLCEEKNELRKRLISIMRFQKKSKLAVALMLALTLLLTGCAAILGAANSSNHVGTNEATDNNDDAQSIADTDSNKGKLLATISFAEVVPYEAPVVETTTLNASDIASVMMSYTLDNGIEIIFYKAKSGIIYCAYKINDNQLVQFFEAGLYEEGYDIKPYDDIFGHSGFRIQSPVGAAYTAINYYYFASDGTLKFLVQCDNYVIENDMNDDGKKELLWFYHGLPTDSAGAGMAFYYFEQDGQIYEATLDDLLTTDFPDIDFPGQYFTSPADSSALFFTYRLKGEETYKHEFELRFTEDSMLVYSVANERTVAPKSSDNVT